MRAASYKIIFDTSFYFLTKSVEVSNKWFPVCPLAQQPQPGSVQGGSGERLGTFIVFLRIVVVFRAGDWWLRPHAKPPCGDEDL